MHYTCIYLFKSPNTHLTIQSSNAMTALMLKMWTTFLIFDIKINYTNLQHGY